MGVAAGGKLFGFSSCSQAPVVGLGLGFKGKNVPCVALFTYSVKLYYWMYGIDRFASTHNLEGLNRAGNLREPLFLVLVEA